VRARETELGWMPFTADFDTEGMTGFGPLDFEKVQRIDQAEWKKELALQSELFIELNHTMPKELTYHRELLISRL
jgi:GTP-dependent phosphoenolpyruvate carboxykinase